MDGADPHQPPVADVLVEGERIKEIAPAIAERPEIAERRDLAAIDARGKLVIPGFVNAHYHSHDVLAKGLLEETVLEKWRLLALPPAYPKRTAAEVRARTLLGALECLRSGFTTVQDMVTLYPFDPAHLAAVVDAYRSIGVRAVVGLQYADIRGIHTIPYWPEVFPKETHGRLSSAAEPDRGFDLLGHFEAEHLKRPAPAPNIHWALGPSAPERCTDALLERTAELSERYRLPVYTHIYESKGMALQARREYKSRGGSLIRRMKDIGVLGPRLGLAHSVWMLEDEIAILAETATNVVINPLSNLKLKSGIPPIRAFEDAGVTLGLGCDNCSCSDAQNAFQAMKLYCLLAAVSHAEPGPPRAERAWRAATQGGAATAQLGQETGALAPGRLADIVLVNLRDPSFVPLNSALRQLVYSEPGRGVETVIVGGKVVIQKGRLATLDEAAIYAEVDAVMPGFRQDFEAIQARVAALDPYIEEAQRRIWADEVGMNRLFTGR